MFDNFGSKNEQNNQPIIKIAINWLMDCSANVSITCQPTTESQLMSVNVSADR